MSYTSYIYVQLFLAFQLDKQTNLAYKNNTFTLRTKISHQNIAVNTIDILA